LQSFQIVQTDLEDRMLITIITIIVIVTLMVAVTSLYVAGEFAAVSARKSRLIQMANEGNQLAKAVVPILEDHHKLDRYIAASQVGITLSSVLLGIYGQREIAPLIATVLDDLPFLTEVAAGGVSTTLVLIFLTTLQVVLGELVPKSLAIQYPERMALWTSIPMRWSADFFFRPLIMLLNGSGLLLMRLLRIHYSEEHKHVHSPEEIQFLLTQSHAGGLLAEQEHQLLEGAFRFGKLQVGEVTVPRTRITAADVSSPVDDILRVAAQSDYTRIPLYEGDIDHIVGFVHLKELFQLSYEGKSTDVRSILRSMSFVHESSYLDDVWNTLNKDRTYMAIVFDEYGGTVGMVTREDLVEELFGEVQDEFDEGETQPFKKLDENTYRLRGDLSITYLNDRLHLSFDNEDAYTIGGYILNALGHLPEVGDEVVEGNISLRVNAVEDRAIEEVLLTINTGRGGWQYPPRDAARSDKEAET
jgi:putative hemolysin